VENWVGWVGEAGAASRGRNRMVGSGGFGGSGSAWTFMGGGLPALGRPGSVPSETELESARGRALFASVILRNDSEWYRYQA
jgi:hypothetical protein